VVAYLVWARVIRIGPFGPKQSREAGGLRSRNVPGTVAA
jgi:hypothetical protein